MVLQTNHISTKEPMANKVRLTDEQINFLAELPEQGMGYQLVDIKFKNGYLLKKRVVLNSTYLQIEEDEMIDPKDFETILII